MFYVKSDVVKKTAQIMKADSLRNKLKYTSMLNVNSWLFRRGVKTVNNIFWKQIFKKLVMKCYYTPLCKYPSNYNIKFYVVHSMH
jgi:hypothetical protein